MKFDQSVNVEKEVAKQLLNSCSLSEWRSRRASSKVNNFLYRRAGGYVQSVARSSKKCIFRLLLTDLNIFTINLKHKLINFPEAISYCSL